MSLISQYGEAEQGGTFAEKVSAALWEKALAQLLALTFTDPATAGEKREARAIRDVLKLNGPGASPVVRLLVSADLTAASSDAQIQSAIDGNWDKIVLLFDPTLDAEA